MDAGGWCVESVQQAASHYTARAAYLDSQVGKHHCQCESHQDVGLAIVFWLVSGMDIRYDIVLQGPIETCPDHLVVQHGEAEFRVWTVNQGRA